MKHAREIYKAAQRKANGRAAIDTLALAMVLVSRANLGHGSKVKVEASGVKGVVRCGTREGKLAKGMLCLMLREVLSIFFSFFRFNDLNLHVSPCS